MNRILAISAAAALACGTVAVPASTPAYADFNGGSLRHGNDQGYDLPILVKFAGESSWVGVPEGEHSDHLRPNGKEDVDYVKVRNDGEMVSCEDTNGLGYFVFLDGSKDANNIKAVGNYVNLDGCVIGLVGR